MIRGIHQAFFVLLLNIFLPLSGHMLHGTAPPPGSEAEIAKLVFEYTNRERVKRGLAAFLHHTTLEGTGRYHARNMAQRNFFSHVDPDGLDPSGRFRKLYPGIIAGIGENIVYHHGETPEIVAQNMVRAWMESPSHRKAILAGGYTHLGVGVAIGEYVYGVQMFGELVAELVTPVEEPIPAGTTDVVLWFRYLGLRAPELLSTALKLPDPKAKYQIDESRYSIGSAPLTPVWKGDRYYVSFDVVMGEGEYSILAGYGRRFFPDGVTIQVD